MNKQLATKEFIDTVLDCSVKRGVEDMQSLLQFATDSQTAKWSELSKFYTSLDENSKENIKVIIRESIVNSLISLFVLFDGASGYTYISEKPCTIQLSICVYANENDATSQNIEQEFIIAPVKSGEDLHDVFINSVETLYSDGL